MQPNVDTYERSLLLCGFRISDAAAGRRREDVIYPGVFLAPGLGDRPMGPEAPDEPYFAIAKDRPFGTDLCNYAMLWPLMRTPIGQPRLDRVRDLSEIIFRKVRWLRENPEHPFSGFLPNGTDPPLGAMVRQFGREIRCCVRVWDERCSDDPAYPNPLSWFGHVFCLHPLLRDHCRSLVRSLEGATPPPALGRIVTNERFPLVWSDGELELLEQVQGELYAIGDLLAAKQGPSFESDPPLVEADQLALKVLDDTRLQLIAQIASAVAREGGPRDRGSIGAAVKRLIGKGLVERPFGKRRGARLTPAGARVRARLHGHSSG